MPRKVWLLPTLLWLIMLLFMTQALSSCSLYTVRPIQTNTVRSSDQFNQHFDPVSYTNSIWASKVVPTVMDKSVDLPTLLTALKADTTGAEKQYAALSSSGTYNFIVKGQGKVTDVRTDSRNGTVNIQLPGVDTQTTVLLQVGPVIVGTALRDSMSFINFNQFSNQVQYAEVSDQLNAHAAKDLQATEFSTLKGKDITFYGVFTLLDAQHISIVPVKIVPGGGN